jgi:hypothetical protein
LPPIIALRGFQPEYLVTTDIRPDLAVCIAANCRRAEHPGCGELPTFVA